MPNATSYGYCGSEKCKRLVKKFGLICQFCSQPFHPKCGNFTQREAVERSCSPEHLWFCVNCSTTPFVRCMLILAQKYDRLLAETEQRLNARIASLETNMQRGSLAVPRQENRALSARPEQSVEALQSPTFSTMGERQTINDGGHDGASSVVPQKTRRHQKQLMHQRTPTPQNSILKTNTEVEHQPPATTAQTCFVATQPTKTQATYAERAATPTILSVKHAAIENSLTNNKQSLLSKTPRQPVAAQCTSKTTKSNYCALTIVCTNVPESSAVTLRGKLSDDLDQWNSVCALMNVKAKPTNLVRVTRHPNSLHYGEPRVIRITLDSAIDVENVLLSAASLKHGSCGIRIYPDVPWSSRHLKTNQSDTKSTQGYMNKIFIHGVPELPSQCLEEIDKHDLEQWRFIRETLSLNNAVAMSLKRLPVSPNYQGTGPRILQLVVQSAQIATEVLERWRNNRKSLPSELRLRAAAVLSRPDRKSSETAILPASAEEPQSTSQSLNAELGPDGEWDAPWPNQLTEKVASLTSEPGSHTPYVIHKEISKKQVTGLLDLPPTCSPLLHSKND